MSDTTEQIISRLPKQETLFKILIRCIGVVIALILFYLGYNYFTYEISSGEVNQFGSGIDGVYIVNGGNLMNVKLSSVTDLENVSGVKFILKSNGSEYVYETSEGIEELTYSKKISFWHRLFGIKPDASYYDYSVNISKIEGLGNFGNVEEVEVYFEYGETKELVEFGTKDEIYKSEEEYVSNTATVVVKKTTGGGGGGGGGSSTTCTPDCSGKTCGTDGCSGSCGGCSVNQTCSNYVCVNVTQNETCISECAGKTCGTDGCGGSCGGCLTNETCLNYTCIALPECETDLDCTVLNGVCGIGYCNLLLGECDTNYNLSSTVCRNSAGICDTAEYCTGNSLNCPADSFASNGTVCTTDSNECTNDICLAGICSHPNFPFGTSCTADLISCTNDVCSSGTCIHPANNSLCSLGETCSVTSGCIVEISAPTNLVVVSVSSNSVNLSWVDNSNNENGFYVQRSLDNLTFSTIYTAGINVRSYNDTGRNPTTTYYYRVYAYNSSTYSSYSNVVRAATSSSGGTVPSILIINHTAVDLYDDIPEYYINLVKKRWLNIPGESHSSGYRIGLRLLSELDSNYAVVITEDRPPANYREDALRVDRFVRSMYNNWDAGAGEAVWYTWHAWDVVNSTYPTYYSNKIKNHINYSNHNATLGNVSAVGFGWCWDMTWMNAVGGDTDEVYGTRWAGSSEGGPDGNARWGLDDEDYTLTGNKVNMDDYLEATQEYIDYVEGQGYETTVFFTTGPVDGNSASENGYQREIKQEYIRNYVRNNGGVLFDYADILTYNNEGEQNLGLWNSHYYPQIHSNNTRDYDENWNMITATEDGDHIGEVGSLRLGKALWVMMARLEGWNP